MTEPSWAKGPPRAIALATDLSARCDRALDRAASLAKAWGARLFAIHALERSGNAYQTEIEQRLPSWRRAPDPVRIVEQQLRDDVMIADQSIAAIVEKGDPADVIMRAAEANACDLIVTGLARDETLGRYGLGSTVERLLRRSRTPLLVVKQRPRDAYKNIVVATDLSDSSRHALSAALAFFPDRRVTLFHAVVAPMARMANQPLRYEEAHRQAAVEASTEFLAASGLPEAALQRITPLIENGHPRQIIHQYVRDRGVDLVVVGTHGRSALLDIFIGSTAKDILSSLSCDALVVREPKAMCEGEKPS